MCVSTIRGGQILHTEPTMTSFLVLIYAPCNTVTPQPKEVKFAYRLILELYQIKKTEWEQCTTIYVSTGNPGAKEPLIAVNNAKLGHWYKQGPRPNYKASNAC